MEGSNRYSEGQPREADQSPGELWLLFRRMPCVMFAFLLHQLVILKYHHDKEPAGPFLLCHMLMRARKTQGTLIPTRAFIPAAACDAPQGV